MSDKPKEPSRFDPHESDYPRAVTPPEGWDSRPKLAIAPRVSDPFEGIPRLRSISEFERERAARDTEPAASFDEDEKTPAERPFEKDVTRRLESVEKRLEKLEKSDEKRAADLEIIKKASQESAQHALEMLNLVKAIDKRQRDFELERKWVPYLAYFVTTAIAVIALIRTFH